MRFPDISYIKQKHQICNNNSSVKQMYDTKYDTNFYITGLTSAFLIPLAFNSSTLAFAFSSVEKLPQ